MRGSLIAGTHHLRREEHNLQRLRIAGVRLKPQINRYLSAFTRRINGDVEDRTTITHGVGADPSNPDSTAYRGLQIPFQPRWRVQMGFNYVNRTGTKTLLAANYLGRHYNDLSFTQPDFASPRSTPAWSDPPSDYMFGVLYAFARPLREYRTPDI